MGFLKLMKFVTWHIVLVLGFAFSALLEREYLVAGEDMSMARPTTQTTTQTAGENGERGQQRWYKLGVDLRGRFETYTGINFGPGRDDTYYLSRLRLNVSIKANDWLRFFLQGQDSEAPGYSRRPVSASTVNPVDFRQGYVEFGRTEKGPWGFRVGRQELVFGNGRLIGNSNWGNVGRTFDAARFTYKVAGTQLDWFTSSVVVPDNGNFDSPHFNNKFHGIYTSFEKLPSLPFTEVVQVYFLLKTNSQARGELGTLGDLDVYTFGTRVNGKLPRNFDYRLEIPVQTGHRSRDRLRAWGGHWQLGYRPPLPETPLRLAAEYNYASGDSNPRDGRYGTFDQLYPTSHDKLGTLDRIGWRNIRDLAGKMEWKLASKCTFNLEYHDFRLATPQDALYAKDGTVVLRNPHAASNRVGDEIDLYAVFQFSKHLEFGAGYAHMFPGDFLKQTTTVDGVSYPYLMWRYRL